MKAQVLVTRESLRDLLNNANPEKQAQIVGRALLVLLANQTADEQATMQTRHHNGKGFGPCDAEFGTSCAKFFQRTGRLTIGQVRPWIKVARNGFPRICKYHGQLNAAAVAKAAIQQAA